MPANKPQAWDSIERRKIVVDWGFALSQKIYETRAVDNLIRKYLEDEVIVRPVSSVFFFKGD